VERRYIKSSLCTFAFLSWEAAIGYSWQCWILCDLYIDVTLVSLVYHMSLVCIFADWDVKQESKCQVQQYSITVWLRHRANSTRAVISCTTWRRSIRLSVIDNLTNMCLHYIFLFPSLSFFPLFLTFHTKLEPHFSFKLSLAHSRIALVTGNLSVQPEPGHRWW